MPSIPRVLHQGLAADKPTADATLNQGWLYYETDTDTLKQSWNGTWVVLNAPAGASNLLFDATAGAGGVTDFTYSGVSTAFAHLEVWGELRTTGTEGTPSAHVIFNSDSGANYNELDFYWLDGTGPGSDALTSGGTAGTLGVIANSLSPSNAFGSVHGQIMNPAGTFAYKKLHFRSWGRTSALSGKPLGLIGSFEWANAAAITDIKVTPLTGDFVEGSRLSIVGMGRL